MPRKEPLVSERLLIVVRRVEHHFNDALDTAVRRLKRADIHAETAGNRGSDLVGVQLLTLDFTALDHIGGESLQYGLLTESEPEGFHVANQPALPVTDSSQRFGQLVAVPAKPGPVLKLVDIHSPHLLRRL